MKKIITIEGMRCGHCTSSVEKALRELPGVKDVSVDLSSGTAVMETTSDIDEKTIRKTIEDLDFTVVIIK